jgi:hypothetical protein
VDRIDARPQDPAGGVPGIAAVVDDLGAGDDDRLDPDPVAEEAGGAAR